MSTTKEGNQAFILKTAAGQWKYEIWIEGLEVSAGAGYETQMDATEDALENNQHLEGLVVVLQQE